LATGLKKLPLLAKVACACCVFWVADGSDCTSHVFPPVPCNGAVRPALVWQRIPPLDLAFERAEPSLPRRWSGTKHSATTYG
jgi:hypothetical protein